MANDARDSERRLPSLSVLPREVTPESDAVMASDSIFIVL